MALNLSAVIIAKNEHARIKDCLDSIAGFVDDIVIVDDESTDVGLRHFQQMIFSQDKPILENQRPRRLPLDPAAETSVRADRSSVAYRRWLHERGVRYGTVPWRKSLIGDGARV